MNILMRNIIVLFVLFLWLPELSSAQKDTLTHPTRFDKYYIYSGILDARDQAIAPFHWNSTQWITCGAIAAIECGMIFGGGDKNLQSFAQRNRNNTSDFIENTFGGPFGSGLYPAILIGSGYLVGCIFHENHPKHAAMLTAKSIVISSTTTFIVKSIAERYRPYQGDNPQHWLGPKGMFSYDSYPSGQTTVAFATATMIALEYPHPLIIPILAYGLATATAYGRINGNYHWGSDVLLGSAIGYFTSKLIFRHNNWSKCRAKNKTEHLSYL